MLRSLGSFPGPVLGVNPRGGEMHPDLATAVSATGASVDLVVSCVPAAVTAPALREAAAAGARAALVCAGGFAEAGEEGRRLQAELATLVADTGLRLLGPNTSGFLAPSRSLTATFVPGAAAVPAGPVAVVAASGGVNHALAFALADTGLGVRLAVGLGNGVDVTSSDVLDHLADDPDVTAVALHVESVGDGRRLVEAVQRLTARVPVAALVVGRADVGDFAASHTGALATSWRTTRAALRQAGAVLVDDERDLVDAVRAFAAHRLPASPAPGVGVVTAQAGPGLLLTDALRSAGVAVPGLSEDAVAGIGRLLPPLTYQRNPVDTGRPDPATLPAVLDAVARDPAVDVVALYALLEPEAFDLAACVAGRRDRTPLVVVTAGPDADVRAAWAELGRAGVPAYTTPAAGAAAVRALVEDARARWRGHHQRAGAATPAALPPLTRDVDEDEAKGLVAAAGIPVLPRRACPDRAAAHAALAELGAPVAVKLLDARVVHKTEVGGVRLGVATATDLDAALDALQGAGARRFLVERMAPPGVDLIVGARRDPVFGAVVVLGLGGVTAEALGDVAVRLAPLGRQEAGSMLDELAGRALVDGFRGGPVVDRDALADAVLALGRLVAGTPGLAEVEVNPLRVLADGTLVALDAVVRAVAGSGADEVPRAEEAAGA
jgi:acetyltransferase